MICGVEVEEIQLGSLGAGLWADAALCCYNATTPGLGKALADSFLEICLGPFSYLKIQLLGYLLGMAGGATGLYHGIKSTSVHHPCHMGIGITLFCQISALFLWPVKDNKYCINKAKIMPWISLHLDTEFFGELLVHISMQCCGRTANFYSTTQETDLNLQDDTFLDSGIGGGRNLACNAHVNLAKLEKARRRKKQERKMTNEAENQRKEEADDKENRDAIDHSRNLFQTFVIVAALIATITFAAAFTIPGGYDGNQGRDQGMAILARAAAFKAFVITNTIAMVCSLTSIFLCLSAVMNGF
ncbi:hypothetical protein RHSIM_Rhsim02G0092900 [Rhododendron simsii]|uniref:PGG domain-containing protein n=1 Tax=Rhododendron simsii TaxID=118357 RepID=A0A834HCK6_RHOSS|nr:hypothetical protein RHSIM_Rhsim02G0092900 [Rhododendron simsii]